MMEYKGIPLKKAAAAAIDKVGKLGGTGGLIAIDGEGSFACRSILRECIAGHVNKDGKISVEIYR